MFSMSNTAQRKCEQGTIKHCKKCIIAMVLTLDGNIGHVANAWRKEEKENQICDCFPSNQMPSTYRITEITPFNIYICFFIFAYIYI